MKVTKYPQSCLLIQKDGHRIVIDPGNFFTQKYSLAELGNIEAVFYTHEHGDHLDESLVNELRAKKIPLYGNADICNKIGDGATEVKSGAELTVAGFKVMPHDLPHFPIQGVVVPLNTGYVIDGTFFHPGDGLETSNLGVKDLAGPLGNSFGQDKVKELAKSLGATRILPIHYSNTALFDTDVEAFAADSTGEFEVVILKDGESAEF